MWTSDWHMLTSNLLDGNLFTAHIHLTVSSPQRPPMFSLHQLSLNFSLDLLHGPSLDLSLPLFTESLYSTLSLDLSLDLHLQINNTHLGF